MTTNERIAFVGGGISSIAAAQVWQKCGYKVQVFEASDNIGGHWTQSYPGVSVQNTYQQYQFAEYPWPFDVGRHPSGQDVLRYIQQFVDKFDIPIQCNTCVSKMTKLEPKGWTLTLSCTGAGGEPVEELQSFDYVVIGTGQYPPNDKKYLPPFPGLEKFKGTVVRSIQSQELFDDKRVAVIGFGKTALDFCTMSASRSKQTVHIFRQPRWTVPEYLLGIDFSIPLVARISTEFAPSWHQSWYFQRVLHGPFSFIVDLFWRFIAWLMWFQHTRDAKLGSAIDKNVLDPVKPAASQLRRDFRAAFSIATPRYYEHVAHSLIEPKHAQVSHFDEAGIVLDSGEHVEVDIACVCCGNQAPMYPFLPDEYRKIVEDPMGGPSLYRFAIDPRIPDLGFTGINCYMHLAIVHLSALWQVAVRRGDIQLPSTSEMLLETEAVRQWKREHVDYEPTGNASIDIRFQQMADIYCQDVGVGMFRKMPNIFAEMLLRYDPTDYAGAVDEYLAKSPRCSPRKIQPMTCVRLYEPSDKK